MIVKTHEAKHGVIVTVVDNDILGKRFEEDDMQIDLTSKYYHGEDKVPEEIGDLMRNAYGVNIVGEHAIQLAIDEGIIDESMVKRIAGIPYYQGTTDAL